MRSMFFAVMCSFVFAACGGDLEDLPGADGGQQDGNQPGGAMAVSVTAPTDEIVIQIRVGYELSPSAGPYWVQAFDAPANAREFTARFDRPAAFANTRETFVIADYRHQPSGRYGWLCEGYTDSGDTQAKIRGSVSVKEGDTAWSPAVWHRTNAVHSDGCVVRAARP